MYDAAVTTFTEWTERASDLVARFAMNHRTSVVFVPLSLGEINDGKPLLKHETGSNWHWSRAGQFYHAQAFLNVYKCLRESESKRWV
jgi:hypothetical protein